jgi:hypothetical protein
MKKSGVPSFALCLGSALMLVLSVLPALSTAQDTKSIIGDWSGALNPGAQAKKRVIVHISAAQDGSLSGAIDYPDQDVSGIQITAITYRQSTLHFESTPSLTVYDGTMSKDNTTITGTWKQGGESINLVLKQTP